LLLFFKKEVLSQNFTPPEHALSQTIAGYHSTPITLADGGAYASPTTLTGTLQAHGGTALYLSSPWSLTITGAAYGANGYGKILAASAYVTIANSGTISGGYSGIALALGGTITNTQSGDIYGAGTGLATYASGGFTAGLVNVSNAGFIGGGEVGIDAGAGTLTNTGTVFAGAFGVLNLATVTNDGLIRGRSFEGISLGFGGTAYNAANATVIGGLDGVYGAATANSTLTNAGYILGGESHGVEIGLGYITNTGTIAGGNDGVLLTRAATLTNAGQILGIDYGSTGISLSQGGVVTNSGTITGNTGLVLDGGTLINSGLIQGETHSNYTGLISPGSASTAIYFAAAGTFIEDSGGIVLGGIIGGGGKLILDGGTLSQVSGFATDTFAARAAATLSTTLAGLGTVHGFSASDELVLTDQTATSAIYANGELTLSNGNAIAISGAYTPDEFSVQTDPDGGTDILIACFCAGTRIATSSGETAVEDLKIGDLVRTLHAGLQHIKWIGTRTYTAPFANHPSILPIRIRAGALGPGIPSRDLYVSPGHAIFAGGVLIHAGRLVNGASITQLTAVETVQYFHIELESHDILFAESCPAETFMGETFRGQFHNAKDFAARYPGARAPENMCLPRLDHGFMLDALRCPLGPATKRPRLGPLRFNIDSAGPHTLIGWARDMASPETPVVLDIIAKRRRLARILANEYRADLRAAGIGTGNHGFSYLIPPGSGRVTIRRAGDPTPFGLLHTAHAAA